MASIAASTANTITQALVPLIEYKVNRKSEFWQENLHPGQSANAFRANIGRDWKVIWNFVIGQAGAAEFSSQLGPEIATTPGTLAPSPRSFQQWDQVETWQGINEMTAVNTVQQELQLKKLKFNMMLPTQLFELEALNTQTADLVTANLDGAAARCADVQCKAWWAETDATTGLKCVVGKITTPGSGDVIIDQGGTDALTLAAATSGALGTSVARFNPADSMDIWSISGSVATKVNTNGPVFVDVVDGFGTSTSDYADEGTIKLVAINGTYVLTVSTTYYLTLRNSQSAPTSMSQLLIHTGTLPYGPSGTGIDVNNYTDCKSLVRDVSGPLSEVTLLKYIARYNHVKGHFNMVDTLMSTEGVWAGFFEGMMTLGASSPTKYERNGTTLQVNAGVADNPSFSLNGKRYKFRTEHYMAAGYLYGIDSSSDNYQLVRPAAPDKAGKDSRYPGIEFLAQMIGYETMWLPYNYVGGDLAGAVTNMVQMPGWMPYEILVRKPGGIRLFGITEFMG